MRTLLTIAVIASIAGTAVADTLVDVYVDGTKTKLAPQARIRDGKTFAPLRDGAEAVGATVEWVSSTQTATISANGKQTHIKKSQGIIVDNQMLIPLRLMAEALGAQVAWDGATKAVRITTPAVSGDTDEGTEPEPKDEGTGPKDEGTG
ncbi:MAG TPA: copper amine oxidase N-terminal domain-containing protein [Armatimonadota bacterium]|nr:copper amine oxidase N-terminal domain-containing protein [Armatimonadota bacterium]